MADQPTEPIKKAGPAKKAPARVRTNIAGPAKPPVKEPEPLPDHKQPLVELAIKRGIPSYEAWAMTVPELTEKLES